MKNALFLTFADLENGDRHEFRWEIKPTGLAHKWLKELAYAVQQPDRVREQRFLGWSVTRDDQQKRVFQLNKSIALINMYYGSRYQIHEWASLNMSQERLNALHHHFEILMGQSWKRSELTKHIPMHIMVAVRLINELVHDFENALRVNEILAAGGNPQRAFHCILVPYRQLKLTTEDLSTFTFETAVGDLVSSYCQLGKTWVEVYHDQDEHIFADNIAPLRSYASTMSYMDYVTTREYSDSLRAQVKKFIRDYGLRKGLPLDPDDPAHAIGHSRLASLPKDSPLLTCSETERTHFFRTHSNIYSIRIVLDGQEFKRDYPVHDDYLRGREFILEESHPL